ncbi:hypothetical protein V1509DRAFT_64518 [Lipomyces kononenkoae]
MPGPQLSLFGSRSETRSLSDGYVRRSRWADQSPLTRQVLPVRPSEYHQPQHHAKDRIVSSDEQNTVTNDREEDPVDFDGSDEAKMLSTSHDLDLVSTARGRSGRDSIINNFANADEHHIFLKGVQGPQIASAQAEQDKPDDDSLCSCFCSDPIASSDSSILSEVVSRSRSFLTDYETVENEANFNGQFKDDSVWLSEYEYKEFPPSPLPSDASDTESITSLSEDESEELVSPVPYADDQDCEKRLRATEEGEKSYNICDEVSFDSSLEMGRDSEVVNPGSSRVVVAGGDVNVTDTSMAADEVFRLSDVPPGQTRAVSVCSTMASEPDCGGIDAVWQPRVVPVRQIGQIHPPPFSSHEFQITNSKRQIIRQVEFPNETAVSDFPLVTDDLLQDVDDVFCKSLLLLVTQYDKKAGQTCKVNGGGTLLVHVASPTYDTAMAKPSGKTGSDEREDLIHSTNTTWASCSTNSIVGVLFLVTILIATVSVCGWLSYNFLLLMAEVWEFLDRGMWCYLNARQRVELLDEIYLKKKRNFYLMARFVVAYMKRCWWCPQPRTFVTS